LPESAQQFDTEQYETRSSSGIQPARLTIYSES
jgi:hypothetical protein